ncbi:hypothetical protein TNCV_220491 [Trichonephila clavipes]|nr:hypothetical protein TNCV_220491 [Trichonephila clavipes]
MVNYDANSFSNYHIRATANFKPQQIQSAVVPLQSDFSVVLGAGFMTHRAGVRFLDYQATATRHWDITLMSAQDCNIKQSALTPLYSLVASDQQLSMGSVPDRRHLFLPWYTRHERKSCNFSMMSLLVNHG